MNFDLGSKIKQLRLSRSMTQEQLAQRLGLTAQAISKWESGTNMPDIQMLPDISVIFGVSIDELFAMTDESRMERIENMIYEVRFIPDAEFSQTERYLKDCQGKPEICDKAGLLLAMLYNKRASEYHELAKPLARKALQQVPGNKDAFVAIFEAEGGPFQDWNFVNHSKMIAFYKEETQKHSDDIRYYFWLLDLLIADCRTDEAREYIEKMRAVEYSYHYEMYMGHICQMEGNMPGAMEWWEKMKNHSPEKYQVWFEYGSILAKLGKYEEAIAYFKKAQPMRPTPRFTDCEDALSQIYEILGDIDGAIAAQKDMLQIVREDWTTEGESIDYILREIQRLEALKQ